MSVAALAADPGIPDFVQVNDQKVGTVLVYNVYTSSAANPTAENTRISVTNADDVNGVSVHFFFIDGSNCSVADSFLCLTANQTMTFYASDADPGITGYIIAVATDSAGIPRGAHTPPVDDGVRFYSDPARIMGDLQVKFASGHIANLGAEALLITDSTYAPLADTAATVNFFLPRVLAISNQPSLADGYDIRLIVNRPTGDLRTTMDSIGNIFGLTFDELENPFSWSAGPFGCFLNRSFNNTNFPRTTPRLNNVIPAGSVGWTKFWSTSGDRGILGTVIFLNQSASGYNSGRNLHKLTATVAGQNLIVPVFPANCPF
jgi:hypothetical protein